MDRSLTACIIARDEARRLPDCLSSVAFCDEIVVVDSGSRDATPELARAAGARVVSHPWSGFAAQRNVAMAHATGDWVLEVDADERVSPELARELRAFLDAPPDGVGAAMLPMRHEFLGRPLGPAGRYPFYRPRLFRRDAYRHDESRTVHEGLRVAERPWIATGEMRHILAGTVREAVRDTWRYAALEAAQLRGRPRSWARALALRPLAKFVYGLIALGGWRDGWRGTLKLSLEAVGDSLVWARRLATHGPGGPTVGAHFSAEPPSRGPVRVLAIGARRAVEQASGWLAALESAGAWVTVVSDAPPAYLHGQRIPRVGPLHLLRALDAQRQLGDFDAVVALDRRARALLAPLPGHLRAAGRAVAPGEPPEAVLGRLASARSADPATA